MTTHHEAVDLEQVPWTPIPDQFADAMTDAPDLCAQCGKPLTDTEPYLCNDCTADAYWATSPLAGEPWEVRFSTFYEEPGAISVV